MPGTAEILLLTPASLSSESLEDSDEAELELLDSDPSASLSLLCKAESGVNLYDVGAGAPPALAPASSSDDEKPLRPGCLNSSR